MYKYVKNIALTAGILVGAVAFASCQAEEDTLYYDSSSVTEVTFGTYAKTAVEDSDTITEIETAAEDSANVSEIGDYDYITVNDEDTGTTQYVEYEATPDNEVEYSFDSGTTIEDGETYYFEVEPITWRVLATEGDNYILMSEDIIDAYNFYDGTPGDYLDSVSHDTYVYDSEYANSEVYSYLNDEFYEQAFQTTEEQDAIVETTITENDTDSEGNVFLLSYDDMMNSDYGFDDSADDTSSRIAVTTDFARATGAWMSTSTDTLGYGTYWTSTMATDQDAFDYYVDEQGALLSDYGFSTNKGIRPCITVSIDAVTAVSD